MNGALDLFAQVTVNGIAVGAIYALVALGIVLIHKATEVLNFAHGDLLVLSAFVAWALIERAGMPFWLVLPVVALGIGALAYGLDAVIVRRIAGQPQFSGVMLTIALAFMIRGAVSMGFGPDSRSYQTPWSGQTTEIAGVAVTELSLVIMLGWVMCFMGTRYLIMGMGLGPTWLIGTALLASSIIVAFPITSVLVRPLAHVLKVEKPVSRHDLVGQVVRIDTSRVDHRFGMARAEDGGAGLIVQVRCDAEANGLTRGSSALVVSYDHRREVYEVTPFDDILPSKRSADA